MWLNSLWHFVASSASIGVIVGGIATAIAILEPKQLDAITDLRKWAIVVAVIAFSYTGVLAHGYSSGLAVKQAQWDAALVNEGGQSEKDREDAVRTVGPMPTDRSMFRSDPFNRDGVGHSVD